MRSTNNQVHQAITRSPIESELCAELVSVIFYAIICFRCFFSVCAALSNLKKKRLRVTPQKKKGEEENLKLRRTRVGAKSFSAEKCVVH